MLEIQKMFYQETGHMTCNGNELTFVDFVYRVSLLTGTRNETIRYYYSRSEQTNVSIFNLDSHTLRLKIVHQTPEIHACKVNIYSAPETRGFEKGPSPDLTSQVYCKGIRNLTLSFFFSK